ncbi:MAG: hypothetical protein QM765_53145 [Myxococcales bacterium]
MQRSRQAHAAAVLVFLLAAFPGAAFAGGPLGPESSRIQTSRYAIDFYSGQVVSAARVIGLAGSFSAIAEGVDAVPINPAAAAVRVPWSYEWFDYDVTLGISFPTAVLGSDVENLGLSASEYRYDGYYVPSVGLVGNFGRTGIGLTFEDRRYSLSSSSETTAVTDRFAASLYSVHAVVARAMWKGQLTFGLGVRLVGFSLIDESTRATRLAMTGISAETGVVVAPTDSRFRLGLVGRLPVSARPQADSELKPNADGDLVGPGNFYLPQSVEVPWEAELSLAFEFGDRPLNPRWENPDEYTRPLRAELLPGARAAQSPPRLASRGGRSARRRDDAARRPRERPHRAPALCVPARAPQPEAADRRRARDRARRRRRGAGLAAAADGDAVGPGHHRHPTSGAGGRAHRQLGADAAGPLPRARACRGVGRASALHHRLRRQALPLDRLRPLPRRDVVVGRCGGGRRRPLQQRGLPRGRVALTP